MKTEALGLLIERVSAATDDSMALDRELADEFGGAYHDCNLGKWVVSLGSNFPRVMDECPSFTGSIDAALALVERVLPGWKFSVGDDWYADEGGGCWARVFPAPREQHLGSGNHYAQTPALALILAMLRALVHASSTKGEGRG